MDSNVERERDYNSFKYSGYYKETLINIVDTLVTLTWRRRARTRHGRCILIVDANEGPMPQTRNFGKGTTPHRCSK